MFILQKPRIFRITLPDGAWILNSLVPPKIGTIVDMGMGEVNYKGDLMPIPELDIGDEVYFPDHTGTEIEDDQSNKYLLINHKHIMAKLERNQ